MKPPQKGPDFNPKSVEPGHLNAAEREERIRDYSAMLQSCYRLEEDPRYKTSLEWAQQLDSLVADINTAWDMVSSKQHRPERLQREHLRKRVQDLALK